MKSNTPTVRPLDSAQLGSRAKDAEDSALVPTLLPPNEKERLEELRRYAVLDTPPEKAFDNITETALRIFRVPIAMVTLIDAERQWFKSCIGLETREMGRHIAFCAHAILRDEVMVVGDAREDSRFRQNPLVTGPPYVRFYAGAPLRTVSGLNLGTLCVVDTKPRKLSKSNLATLSSLATLVVDEIQLRYEIGERLRAAESLRLLQAAMKQSSESVMITTADLDLPGPEILFVNPAFTKVTGYTAEEVVGKTPRILQGAKTDRTVLQDLRARLASGAESTGEAVNYRKDGSEFVLAWDISPIRDDDGKVTNFIGFQRDATERNRAAAALQAAKEEAERANRAKSEFLSRMSHELRTPLNAILGFAELLEKEDQNADDAESVDQITRAGRHLLGLINEVLDLARVEAGHLALTPEPVSVRMTLGETLALVRPMAAAREVHLIDLAGDCDYEVLSSSQRLTQVLLNLLSNAVKFNHPGGDVTVSCARVEDYLRIKVTDTGRGISAADLGRIFIPFERLEITDSVVEGTGLGLSLSKHLIEAMGGRIGVESVKNEGSTFWVELPLVVKSAPAATESLKEGIPSVANAPRRTDPRTVLYIEDNLSNLRLVERILARQPEIKFLASMQGSLGLELARQHLPDLILLDLRLPDLSGEAVLAQLRSDARTKEIPVIMISADATPAQIEHVLAAGAQSYLTKPVNASTLLEAIAQT